RARQGGEGAVLSGIRHADAAAAMISAVVRSSATPVTGRFVRNRRTLCRAAGSPSSSPWNAGTTTTLGGSGQAGRVTASASGTTSSNRTGAWWAAAAANWAPTLFTELIRV